MPDGRVEKNALHAHRPIQLGRSRSASLDGMMPAYPEIFDAVNIHAILTVKWRVRIRRF